MNTDKTRSTKVNVAEINEVFLDAPMFSENRRVPRFAMDFGDVETVGLHLKRPALTAPMSWGDPGYFGIFLGFNEKRSAWAVGVKDVKSFDTVLTGGLLYSSLEELKKDWQLD